MSAIYIETAIQHHPRVAKILARLPDYLPRIDCQHYGDVFNAKAQSFRVQKQQPAYILAAQRGRRVHNTPEQLGIGGQHNFYFRICLIVYMIVVIVFYKAYIRVRII